MDAEINFWCLKALFYAWVVFHKYFEILMIKYQNTSGKNNIIESNTKWFKIKISYRKTRKAFLSFLT